TLGALGSALVFTGQARNALPYLERALEIDPTYGPLAATLAMARVYLGHAEEATASAERAVELSRNDPVAGHFTWFALANAELLAGRSDAPAPAIRWAPSPNPAYAWSRVLLANVLGLQGNRTEAQAALAEAARGFGDTARLVEGYRALHLTRFGRAEGGGGRG